MSFLAEYLTLRYLESTWESVLERTSNEQLLAVKTASTGVQRRVRRIAAEVARHPDVVQYLLGASSDLSSIFDQAVKVSRNQDVGVEVFDRSGTMIAWHGRSGYVNSREVQIALQGALTSYIARGPIYSQLFVISPIRADGRIIGAVLVRQAVEVSYPLSNKFISRAGLAEQLSEDLSVPVEIDFGERAEPKKDGRYISAELNGIDGRKLGAVSILKMSRSGYLELVSTIFQKARAFLYFLLLVFACLVAAEKLRKAHSVLLESVLVTALIWSVRYLMLICEIPSIFWASSIFDPSHFASKFGGGIAKSIGEMTISALALLLNALVVASFSARSSSERGRLFERHPYVLKVLYAAGATTVIYLMLRAYAATIRSAVFDSTLYFNDPRVILPTFDLLMMVFNLIAIGVSFIIVASIMALWIVHLLTRKSAGSRMRWLPWLLVGSLFVVASVLFGELQETPLMSTGIRLLVGAVLLYITVRLNAGRAGLLSPKIATVIFGVSILVLYPLLDQFVHERDRDRVEVFARELLRPVDTWLTFVVNESLHTFATDETFSVLMNGDREEFERLAFTCWAQSSAAKQGYSCAFSVFAPNGEELSRFAIGEQTSLMLQAADSTWSKQSSTVDVRELGSGADAVKIYSGVIPIVAVDQVLGYGVVVVSLSQQSLFRGETPTVFRTSSQENLENFYRPITLTEFRGDTVISSTNTELPVYFVLPRKVHERFSHPGVMSFWNSEHIGDNTYEVFYARRSLMENKAIALGLEEAGLRWHLIGFVRLILYYTLVLLLAAVVAMLVMWARQKPYRLTFRDRLLGALLATAAVPVLVIAFYARTFASDRLTENMSDRLAREIEAIDEMYRFEVEADSTSREDIALAAQRLAWRTKTDFNFYVGTTVSGSSRPELFESGILDRRLSGSAYENIFVRGKRFYLEKESIGLYQYAVGYQPVLDERGKIAGLISVPTLYRQEEIDREVAQINAVLFGISAIIFVMIAVIATTFANRIAAPIHELTKATKRLSLGDLDVRVHARAEGEIGELIRSFATMTKDLKRSRENLVQYERELAWKEMAKQVAHEIKNPLTPMKLALQHLRQTYKDKVENFDEIFEEVSQMVIRQVDALSRIASEFSSFARMPSARLEKCSLNDVLREAVYLFEQDTRVKFATHFGQHIPPIMADREELRRAFINIIRNGIQAMNGEGRMIVTTEQQNGGVEIRIRDFGVGIPDEIKGKLFQPNFSTKTDGMGLGLAIVKKTVEDMQGSITLESVVNEGTTVIVHIPLPQVQHG
ncbi:MAG: HAMP domain-containing protein [Ignavibacteriae bacterium]|nr:HAMP domain-containing protein [Ignavibacteriota bacterium]